MRFLLFNLVVVGALGYLFIANGNDIQKVADTAHTTVAQVAQIATTVVDTVNEVIEDPQAQVVSKPIPPVEAAPAKPAKPIPPVEATPATPNEPVEEPSDDGANSAKKAEESTPPALVASNELPTTEVSERPVHKVPDPGAAQVRVPVTDPAVARRRAEVLGEATPARGGTAKPAITVAEGEQLMSPAERRRALFALAQKMELMFLKKTIE